MRWTRDFHAGLRGMAATIAIVALFPCDVGAALRPGRAAQAAASSGCGNPDEARRVVMDRDREHVFVRLCSGEKLRGRILSVAQEHFVLDPNGPAAPIEIAYRDVRQFGGVLLLSGQRAPRKRIRVLMAALVAAYLVAFFIECHDSSC